MSRITGILFLLAGAAVLLDCGSPGDTYPTDAGSIERGRLLFATHCSSCHGIQHDGIGPPLRAVTTEVDKERLIQFIQDPAASIAAGDERFRALQLRYKLEMPSYDWIPADDLADILAFLHQTSLHSSDRTARTDSSVTGLSGRLVPPVKASSLSIVLEDVVALPLIGATTDLGVVTLRAHPSGDGTLFAGDQNGVIYHIRGNTVSVYLDMRLAIADFQAGPGIATGVGSFDFHPDFLQNGLLYITHAEAYKGQRADYTISDSLLAEVQWVVGEWKVDDVHASVFSGTHRELLRLHAPTFGHGCQEIAFIPGLEKTDPEYGLLYIGFGDGGSNNIRHPELGHRRQSFLGSIMRIDPGGNNSRNGQYGIPETNPFAGDTDPSTVKEIFAYGFRNPHRMSWDEGNGNRMMVTDIGESNIEELNIVEAGGDYGWPVREGDYGINTLNDLKTVFALSDADLRLFRKPFAQYDHEDGFAISGGHVYDGSLAALRDKYIFGDIVNGRLFYLPIDRPLSDSTIYEIQIVDNGKKTNLREMANARRLHLRISYDRYRKEMYIITKIDGRIRRIADAFWDTRDKI